MLYNGRKFNSEVICNVSLCIFVLLIVWMIVCVSILICNLLMINLYLLLLCSVNMKVRFLFWLLVSFSVLIWWLILVFLSLLIRIFGMFFVIFLMILLWVCLYWRCAAAFSLCFWCRWFFSVISRLCSFMIDIKNNDFLLWGFLIFSVSVMKLLFLWIILVLIFLMFMVM